MRISIALLREPFEADTTWSALMIINFRKSLAYLFTCSVLLGLCGCTTVMPNFNRMSSAYAQSLAQYQADSILLNVVHASEERALNFLDIPSITGSGNVSQSDSLGLALGGLSVGNLYGAIVSGSPSASVAFGTSFSFSQSSLDNATFWKGLVEEIPLQRIFYAKQSRYPRELLFSLVIDSIVIEQPDAMTREYQNNPSDIDYTEFTELLYRLLDQGLDIEKIKVAQLSKVKQDKTVKPTVAQPTASHTTEEFRLCLKGKASNSFNAEILCDGAQKSGGQTGKERIYFRFRSPKDVFFYLGQVVTAQNRDQPFLVEVPPTKGTRNRKPGENNRYALFVVNRNPLVAMSTYAIVSGSYGDDYAIPRNDNGYTPIVMELLTQMIIQNKVTGSIPQQPAVLIR